MFVIMNRFSLRFAPVLTATVLGLAGCGETPTYDKAPDANKAAQEKTNEDLKNMGGKSAQAQGAIPKSIKGGGGMAIPAAPASK